MCQYDAPDISWRICQGSSLEQLRTDHSGWIKPRNRKRARKTCVYQDVSKKDLHPPNDVVSHLVAPASPHYPYFRKHTCKDHTKHSSWQPFGLSTDHLHHAFPWYSPVLTEDGAGQGLRQQQVQRGRKTPAGGKRSQRSSPRRDQG